MRRASSPAICTTPTRAPSTVSSSSALRSLSSLALSRSAERNRPGRYRTSRTRPSAGARWACTSSTERETLTRGAGARGRASPGGGTTSEGGGTVAAAAGRAPPGGGGGGGGHARGEEGHGAVGGGQAHAGA